MYAIIASVKGEKTMTNEEIKAAMDEQMIESLYETAEDVEKEKNSGFLLYEGGCWNQYAELN